MGAPLNTADDTCSRFSRTSSYAPKSKLQLLTATAAKIRSDTDFRHIRRLIQHDSVYELIRCIVARPCLGELMPSQTTLSAARTIPR